MEKENLSITSTPTNRAFIIVQRVLSLYHLLQFYVPQNLGVAPKLTTLAMESMFFFADSLLHLQAVFRVARKINCGRRVSLHKLIIDRVDLHQ